LYETSETENQIFVLLKYEYLYKDRLNKVQWEIQHKIINVLMWQN